MSRPERKTRKKTRVAKEPPAERLLPHPDCGLKTRSVDESEEKCRVVVEATKVVRKELARHAMPA